MKQYIKPSIEVIKFQTEDAILSLSGQKQDDYVMNSGETTESAWSQDKGFNNDIWSSED